MARNAYQLLWMFTVAVLAFVLGMLSTLMEGGPVKLFREAFLAYQAVQEVAQPSPSNEVFQERPSPDLVESVATRFAPGLPNEELILCTGGRGYHSEIHDAGCLAWLMNRCGDIVHSWKYDQHLWDDHKVVTNLPVSDFVHYPIGIHLYPDGSLLASFQGSYTFPFAVGIARFDKDSNLLWKKENLAHHWLTVGEDGRIYVPTMRIVDAPIPLGLTDAIIDSPRDKLIMDSIAILGPDGETLDEISVLDALFDSGWHGLLWKWENPSTYGAKVNTEDPLHTNDARVITADDARRFPQFNPGDIMVSMRQINAVGVIDPQTRKFKWMTSGSVVRQHSPRIWRDGLLMVDNLGGVAASGGTQLVYIDFLGRTPSVIFPLPGQVLPSECRTESSGHLDLSADESRGLLTLPVMGRIWEVDVRDGKLLWEYRQINTPGSDAPPDAVPTIAVVHTAKYVKDLTFPLNGKENRCERSDEAP